MILPSPGTLGMGDTMISEANVKSLLDKTIGGKVTWKPGDISSTPAGKGCYESSEYTNGRKAYIIATLHGFMTGVVNTWISSRSSIVWQS